MIWVAGRSPTLVSQNLKATTLTYLAIPLMSKLFWLQGYRQLKLITTLHQDIYGLSECLRHGCAYYQPWART
jgi:hypothetical protein